MLSFQISISKSTYIIGIYTNNSPKHSKWKGIGVYTPVNFEALYPCDTLQQYYECIRVLYISAGKI